MEATSGRIDATGVVGRALDTYRDNFAPLFTGALLLVGISGLISGYLGSEGGFALAFVGNIIGLIAQALFTGYVVKMVQDLRDGQRDWSTGDLLSAVVPFIATLILNGILFGLGVAIGLVLLIVPGLFLLTIWAVTHPAIVVEGKGVIEAFGRSRELVKGDGWSVFGAIVIAFLLLVAATIVFTIAGAIVGGTAGAVIVGALAQAAAAPVPALVASIMFFDLGGGTEAPSGPAGPA